MNKPYVICHILSNLEGKIAVKFLATVEAKNISIEYARIRSSYNERPNYDDKESNINVEYKLDGIENGNYHFTREENINGEITNFTGDKSDNKTEGVMTSNNTFTNYFIYDNINLIKTTDKYEVTSELYHFNNITDDKNI